ncbi:hypothetical protein TruAng_008887 [Truncatella angustata]|nr:hypothetical protein TruAng_008887 [Truncatella angustata]
MANTNSRRLPVFAQKVAIENYLIENSKTSALTYTFVYNGGFLNFCLQHNILLDISKYWPKLFDGGDYTFSSTSMPTVGDAIVGVLTHPADTQNRAVYVSEIITSQNQMSLRLLQKKGSLRDDVYTVVPILIQSMLSPEFGGRFDGNDNKLLNIKEKSEDFLMDLLRPLLE